MANVASRCNTKAEVGLLSRAIVVEGHKQSSEPTDVTPVAASSYLSGSYPHPARFLTGYGGHIFVMDNGIARLSSVELRRMGQTNMLGRYPFHLHRLGARGKHSYIEDSAIWRSFYRGVSVHATSGKFLLSIASFCARHFWQVLAIDS